MTGLCGKRIILGSGSPRRRELLHSLDIDFMVDTGTYFKESFNTGHPDGFVPERMSDGKSLGFHRPLEKDEILITADTMVFCGNEMMGKPRDRADAGRMLKDLSGNEHQVITAVTIRSCDGMRSFSDMSRVWFKDLTDEEINYYIDTYKPYDKAGAYGCQEWIGAIGISRIEGSFYNIMGFPVHRVWEELHRFLEG